MSKYEHAENLWSVVYVMLITLEELGLMDYEAWAFDGIDDCMRRYTGVSL